MGVTVLGIQHNFYPRSPCGERLYLVRGQRPNWRISIHALLAESDLRVLDGSKSSIISIHALLAESDRGRQPALSQSSEFLSTLSLRRATLRVSAFTDYAAYFYPRSPCGERLFTTTITICTVLFLSTLSLRRATSFFKRLFGIHEEFLSTLSLRRATMQGNPKLKDMLISIHALLAESDRTSSGILAISLRFLSTLSLRRATEKVPADVYYQSFLSTLSLRRATSWATCGPASGRTFLSTLSLRRATSYAKKFGFCDLISIHALLAESDVGDVWACQWPDISIHALLAESD